MAKLYKPTERYIEISGFDNWDYSEHFDGPLTEDAVAGMDAVLTVIDITPRVEIPSIVRCKDCIHCYEALGEGYRCTQWGTYNDDCSTDPMGWCSKGERKDSNP